MDEVAKDPNMDRYNLNMVSRALINFDSSPRVVVAGCYAIVHLAAISRQNKVRACRPAA